MGVISAFAVSGLTAAMSLAFHLHLQPTPARQIAGGISDADYPAEAIRAEAQGTVEIDIAVNRDGRVTGCTTVSSAGHPALDSAPCQLVTLRFRYRSATAGGRAVAATLRRRITWKLPPSLPRPSASATLEIMVGPDGRVTACKLVTPGPDAELNALACGAVQQHGQFEPARHADGTAITSTRHWSSSDRPR